MSQQEDLVALDLRLSRLEMRALGVKLTTLPTQDTSKSLIKSMSSLSTQDSILEEVDGMDIIDSSSSNAAGGNSDFASRLTTLEQTINNAFSKSSQQRSIIDQLDSHWKEIHDYFADLDPGTALTHQQQIAAPLLYRRQEVLACADELKQSMQQVAEILNLLMIGQNINSNSKISEMHVTKAPILCATAQPALSTREEQEQLDQVEKILTDLAERVDVAALKMDRMLTGYQQFVTTVSEKLVLLDEEIRNKKQ
mmetsp:Transcript_7081/g.14761  ORF Transcript_7081/g.14761 Transcript_7081/m.14761 type:complete len:253 (-) Transcript_7081:24-782(-)